MADGHELAKTPGDAEHTSSADAAVTLISRVLFGNSYSSKKSKLYASAFYLDEVLIRELDERACERIGSKALVAGTKMEFTATVRFADNSSQSFTDLARLLKRAADVEDPESIEFAWKGLIDGHGLLVSGIEADFTTEKRMKTGSVGAFEIPIATMQLEIFGGDEHWVESTFANLMGVFETARLPWIYAPLLVFRNKVIVQVLANGMAMSGFFIFVNKLTYLLTKSGTNYNSALTQIIGEHNLDKKIDLLGAYLITPVDNAWWNVIVTFGGGFVVYLSLLFCLLLALPSLVPRSVIAIGLIKHRLIFWANVLRFIFLSLALCGVIVPVTLNLIPLLMKTLR